METINTNYVTENDYFMSDPVLVILNNYLVAENITHLVDVEWIRNNFEFKLPRKNTKGLKEEQHDLLKRLKTAYVKALHAECITRDFRYYLDDTQDEINQAVDDYELEILDSSKKIFALKTCLPEINYVIRKNGSNGWSVNIETSKGKFLMMTGGGGYLGLVCRKLTDESNTELRTYANHLIKKANES